MTVRPRRSALYLPGSNVRAIAKARQLACDVVILDLEDAVAPDAKDAARAQVVEAVREGGFGARELVVRVNALSTQWGAADLQALQGMAPDAVLVPKIASAQDVADHRTAVGGETTLWLMIETALSTLRLEQIAAAPGVAALVLGTNDLAKELNARPGVDRMPFQPLLAATVAAARAFGLAALDGVYNDLSDEEGLVRQCAQAVEHGFDGKTLIHPDQIGPCNAAFSPDAAQIAEAEAIRDAFALPENADKGVIRLSGRMVERLHLDQALKLLARV